MNTRNENVTHVVELQTLRGIAAALVAVSHMLRVYELPQAARLTLDSLINAHAAVVLFFVLSGYVLGLSLLRSAFTPRELAEYYLRRLFRIFPAVFAISGLSTMIILAIGHESISPAPSTWFSLYMSPLQMTISNVLLSFLALKAYLIPPIWTILTELVGSLFLPLFVWIAFAKRKFTPLLALAALGLAVALPNARFHLDTLSYLFCFMLGVGVLLIQARIGMVAKTYAVAVGVLAAVSLLFFRAIWFVVTTGQFQLTEFDYFAVTPSIVEAISGAVLIVSILRLRGQLPWLESSVLKGLGDISYSVYLIHFLVMYCMAKLLSPVFHFAAISNAGATMGLLIVSCCITIVTASITYRLIELPGIRIGKRIIAALTTRNAAIQVPMPLRTVSTDEAVHSSGDGCV